MFGLDRLEYENLVPSSIIKTELDGLYGQRVLQDMKEAMECYNIYENGADYTPPHTDNDSPPSDLRYKIAKALLDKEARFLFSKSPDFWVDINLGDSKEERTKAKEAASVYQSLIDIVLERNNFKSALLKACKDCFISKRIAIMFNIDVEKGIQISFLPSMEFLYDVDPNDANQITKIVVFYGLNDEKAKVDQRIYKKKYWLENGLCHYLEEIYDGTGKLVETIHSDTITLFTFIPAWVVVNDGLTGDLIGRSEIEMLAEYESWYSKLAAGDIDAERKGMNPIRYTVDASPESTKDLSIAAGAFWDLSSDQNQAQDRAAQVGVLDSPMSYSSALSTTLDRVKNTMYEQCSVPNVSPEALKGVVSSGKTLKAIYWDLIVRCDEKMLEWRPALQFICRCIIEGARLYPAVLPLYIEDQLPDQIYSIRVDNQYPLPEDEADEKQTDLSEVNAQTMSRKAYMKKWRNLTDDEADEELRQIALERELLENSYFDMSNSQQQEVDETQEAQEAEKLKNE